MRWLSRLGEAKAITLQAWILLAIGATIVGSFMLLATFGGAFLPSLALSAAGALVVGAWFWLAKKLFLGESTISQRPLTTAAVFFTGGLIFLFFVSRLGDFLEIYELFDPAWYRIPFGALSFTAWNYVAALAMEERARTRGLMASLGAELQLEQSLGTTGLLRLEEYRTRVAREIQAALNQAFEKIPRSKVAKNQAGALHDLIDEVVKPLGRKLASREPDEEQIRLGYRQTSIKAINALEIIKLIPNLAPFNPLALILLSTLVGFVARSWVTGYVMAVWLTAISCVLLFALSFLAQISATWLRPKISSGSWAGIFVATVIVISVSDALVTVLLIGLNQDLLTMFLSISLSNFLMQVCIAAVVGLSLERTSMLSELESAVKRVAWMNARLNQLTWVEKRRLAKLVHGDIQARIMATALSIDIERTDEETAQKLLDSLRADCEAALLQPVQETSLPKFISALSKIWRASVQIESEISDEALQILQSDSAAADAVAEIIREGINNAVRHGGANKVSIGAKMQVFGEAGEILEVGLLKLSIRNNGRAVGVDSADAGLGTELLTQLTLNWSLTQTEDGALLSADVPLRAPAPEEHLLVG